MMTETSWEETGSLLDYWRYSNAAHRERAYEKAVTIKGSEGRARECGEISIAEYRTTPHRGRVGITTEFEARRVQHQRKIKREETLQIEHQRKARVDDIARKDREAKDALELSILQALEDHASDECEVTQSPVARLKIRNIVSVVSKHTGVAVEQIIGQRRVAPVVAARQYAMLLSRGLTLRSLPEIGRAFGGRDHTTVLHGIRKMAIVHKTPPLDSVEFSHWCQIQLNMMQAGAAYDC